MQKHFRFADIFIPRIERTDMKQNAGYVKKDVKEQFSARRLSVNMLPQQISTEAPQDKGNFAAM